MGSDQIFFNGSFLLGTYSDIWLERVPAFFGSARFKKGSITLGFHFWCLFWSCCSLVGKMWCASVFTISCEDIFSPLQWVQ
ncbi:hypothetical protein MANES_04G000450v8 [Manihot esculenta]|uniref:Uncharacterized protein n=1 Tax=Manihot esculenta TaxID=3983 RepID=A0ACB7HTE2_MANES|nr:hypothetical protein MANES_04G000450v8 [Manihot esculenta]